jgi:ABC-type dipeptide/oligopeptide/nickel transport system permease component
MNAVPGSPFLGDKPLPPKVIENLTKKYGLDQPLYVQYLTYGKNIILKGDFGQSIKKIGQQVSDIIGRSFPVSARLGLVSVAFATVLGTLLGITGALKRNTMTDRTVMFISTLGIAVPGFVLATSSIILFAVLIKIFPTYGLTSPLHYVLPGLALSFQPLSYITRLTRSTMLDVLNQDYIRTARAKGLKEQKVIFKHALRNAILPVVTYLGPLIAGIITGTFVVERIFAIPGLGRYFVDSITNRDYPVILGTTIFFGAILILMNLLVDIVYVIVNPQIKLEN